MRPDPPPGYVTLTQAAAILGVTRQCVVYYTRRTTDPLPVRQVDGWPCIALAELQVFERHALRRRQAETRQRAVGLLERGYSLQEAAAHTALTFGHVSRLAAPHGGTRALRRGALTLEQVGALFGASPEKVERWVLAGYLPARRTASNGRTYTTVTRDGLWAFVAERRAWMTYTPEAITDAPLRTRAQQMRREAAGRWCGLGALGKATGYSMRALRKRVAAGRVGGEVARWGHILFVWVPDGADLRALVGDAP